MAKSKSEDKPKSRKVGGKVPAKTHDGRPTRAERSAERRAQAEELRQRMRDSRGTHTPRQTRPITREDAELIIERVAEGDTVIGMCRELGLHTTQFVRMKDADDELRQKYERALSVDRPNAWAEDLVEIAQAPVDPLLHALGGGQTEMAQRALVINTKKWIMGKHSAKYSDKPQVETTVNVAAVAQSNASVDGMSTQDMISELTQRHRRLRSA